MITVRSLSSFITLLLSLSITACATDTPKTNTMVSTTSNSTATLIPATNATDETQATPSFDRWLEQLITDIRRQGIQETTLTSIKPYLRLNQRVIELDQQQPEFTQTFWTYIDKRLSEIRVQAGKLQGFRYESMLKKIEQEHGLPAEILLAFWGLETNYGTYLGNFNTLEALTTLAYDPRRSSFFRKEL